MLVESIAFHVNEISDFIKVNKNEMLEAHEPLTHATVRCEHTVHLLDVS